MSVLLMELGEEFPHMELYSGHIIVQSFLRPLLRFEELSRRCLREVRLREHLEHFVLERLISVMSHGTHFLKMPLVEVREQSFHQLPPRGIDKGKIEADLL